MQYNEDIDDILELYGCKLITATPNAKRLRSPESEADISDVKIRAVESPFSPSSYSLRTATPTRLSSLSKLSTNRGKVLLKYGNDISSWKKEYKEEEEGEDGCRKRVDIKKSDNQSHVPSKSLYMYEKLFKKAEALDSFCEELGNLMSSVKNTIDNKEQYNDDNDNDGDEQVVLVGGYSRSQYQVQTYGRICCDGSEGKLNALSVLLEGTRRISSGVRVKLDLGRLNQYSIFPGQIVSVKGVNPTGNSLVVKNLLFESPPPLSDKPKLEGGDLKIVVAAGPFTNSDNLAYEPLIELIKYAVDNEPDVIILVGPFLEFNHQDIIESNMSSTFDEFFKSCIDNIMNGLKDISVEVVIVSSNRDVNHDPIYPTPEYKFNNKYKNLHLMPDPCMIDIEGLIIGTTSVDPLMHLGREEISFNATRFDRLTRLATHILAQRSFYPLVPPSEDLNVDFDLWEKYAYIQQRPHIMILPSSLRYFCKNIYECLVINPERLSKGSFARMQITSPKNNNTSSTSSSSSSSWNTKDNISVQILKI